MTKQTKAKITEAFWSGDWEAMRALIKAEYDSGDKPTGIALNEIGLSSRTFYDSLAEKGNPRIKTLFKILSGIK